MTDLAAHAGVGVLTDARPKLDGFGNIKSIIIFGGLLAAALLYVAYSLSCRPAAQSRRRSCHTCCCS
jgi:hypothetical protein